MNQNYQLALGVIAQEKCIPVDKLKQIIDNAGKEPETTDSLLSKKEVASKLSVSLPTVDRLIRKGILQKVTLSPQIVRIPLKSVENYLAGLQTVVQ